MLSAEEIESEFQKLPLEWSLVGGTTLERVYESKDFATALELVNQIGKKAEKANHHPDIHLSWGRVVVSLTTHSENALTQKDFDLAAQLG